MSVILILGAPGCGKSTVAAKLHERWKCPWFEFGWIPEFRNLNPHTEISYEAEEQISLENLMLVTENYLRHGYERVLLTDIRWELAPQLQAKFGDRLQVIALYAEDEIVLRHRILTRKNGNEYRNADAACAINRALREAVGVLNAIPIRCDDADAASVAARIIEKESRHMINQELWEKCVAFHGHECPGLTIGYRAALYAAALLEHPAEGQVVCISETKGCPPDAFRVLLGCSEENDTLRFQPGDEVAFTVCANGHALRLALNKAPEGMTREESFAHYHSIPAEEMFAVEPAAEIK